MTPDVPADLRPWLALASALFLALGLVSFWYLARGVGQGSGSRAEVMRRAAVGEVPPGAGPVVASGVVRALGAPLVAPLSGVECVSYFYRMYYMARPRYRAGRLMEVPVYWGHAARPFAIDSPAARFHVLAVPLMLDAANPRGGADVVERARQLVAATRFEEVGGALGLGPVGSMLQLANTMFTDDDGEARRDWTAPGQAREPQTLLLAESVLPVGQVASVAGTWSPERRAIVAGGEGSVGPGVSVILGPPANLAGHKGVPLPDSLAASMISATVFTALGMGLVWFSIAVLPGLR